MDNPASVDIELCVVVPTFNEVDNVDELVRRVSLALGTTSWEMILVDDDSPDGTASRVRSIARRDQRIRCIQRLGRRGLAGACVEGLLASAAPYVAVMDADLQHDERCLPRMLQLLRGRDVDLVVGSRYTGSGGVGEWNATRSWMSRFATTLSGLVDTQHVTDPMSGFFMMRREVLEGCARSLSTLGFKILLDIITTSPGKLRTREVPYTLRVRSAGESKLNSAVLWEFGVLLASKLFGRYVPVRFLARALLECLVVGASVAIASLLLGVAGLRFHVSQMIAGLLPVVSEFWATRFLAHRVRTLRGWRGALNLLSNMLACGPGVAANVAVATYLFEDGAQWPLAMLSGVLVGMIWNYAVAHVSTWGSTK